MWSRTEENVKAVVTKIVLGEADAGIVYRSDISANVSEYADAIELPDNLNVLAEYPIALVRDASSSGNAEAFVRYLLSDEGQHILTRFGFMPVK